MPGTTPNYGFTYPLDVEQINVAHDIEELARDVDGTLGALGTEIDAERVDRVNADSSLNTQISLLLQAVINGVDRAKQFKIQAGYVETILDPVFAGHVLVYPQPFATEPIVVAIPAAAPQQVSVGVEHSTLSTTQVVVYGRKMTDGSPATGEALAFMWIGVGFTTPS